MEVDDLLPPVPGSSSSSGKSRRLIAPTMKPGDQPKPPAQVEEEEKTVQDALETSPKEGPGSEGWGGEEAEAIAAKFGSGFGGF